jgi:hypothetical protein
MRHRLHLSETLTERGCREEVDEPEGGAVAEAELEDLVRVRGERSG